MDKKCIKCGKKGTKSLMKDFSLDYYTCKNCEMDVRQYLWMVTNNSSAFRMFTWQSFFNKFNYGKNKKIKYP